MFILILTIRELHIQSSLVNPAQSVPSKKNPDYQFRIDEGINTCKRLQKSFSDKSGFRTNQGFPD